MYQSFYKLTGKPFRLSPDPGFFFPSRGHKRALAYLRYGLKQDEGFVVITGAPGTGKTTLAKILLNEMGDSNVVVAHLTTTQLDSSEMLRMVVASFGLRYEGLDKASLLKTLESFLLARARERKRALLVIDEAQNLPAASLEELRMLSNMQAGDKALVQTFLLGQDQFRKVIEHQDMDQLRQRVIANFQLSPLAADESQRYIESRLSQVGWVGDPTFAEIAYENIHAYTDGIPRRINMLCDRVMLFACMEERHQITAETIQQVIAELEQEKKGTTNSIERLKQSTQASKAAMDKLEQSRNKSRVSANNKQKRTDTKISDEHAAMPTREMSRLDIEDTLIIKGGKADTMGMEDTLSIKGAEADAIRQATKAGKKKRANTPKVKSKKAGVSKKDDPNSTAQIYGNTLAKKKPANAASNTDSHGEISERDLFRVIPGGKQPAVADTGMDRTVKMSASSSRKPASRPPSAEDVVLRRILRLVLAFHRSPSRFPGLDNIIQPLPEGITELLELAVSDDQTLTQVSPAAVMGISPVMLRAAVRFFVRRSLFITDADDNRVLGLQAGADQALIEKHYDLMMRLLRQDKQRGSADSIARIGEAYEALSRIDYAVQASRLAQQAETSKASNTVAKKSNTILPRRDEDEDTLVIGGNNASRSEKGGNRTVEVNGDISFDFTDVQHEPVYDKHNGMLAKVSESFSFEDSDDGLNHKRMRYAGQMAVLGFGALVIILGLYIVQIDPAENKTASGDQVVAKVDPKELSSAAEKDMAASFADISDNKSARQDRDSGDDSDTSTEDPASTQSDIADLLKKMESRRMKIRESRHSRKQKQLDIAQTEAANEVSAAQSSEQSSSILDAINEEQSADIATTASASPGEVSEPARKVVKIQSRRMTTTRSSMTPSPRLAPNSGQTTARIIAKPISSASASSQTATRPITQPITTRVISPIRSARIDVAPRISPQTSKPTNTTISKTALNSLLAKFSRAYQAGDINTLASLFSLNARTNNQTSSVGIRSDYLELFQGTKFRAMSFPTLNWENQGPNRVRGLGTYEARINAKGADAAKIYTGKLTLRVERISNELKISQFYFTEDGIKNVGGSTVVQSSGKVTQSEVDRFVTSLVDNYEQSRLDQFMALFATGARTNDQTTLAGIRKDHQDLFSSTSARQMFLKNLKWRFEGSRAYGSGDFEVLIQANNSSEFVSYVGKITIKLLKSSAGLKLTHFLHNTQ